MATAASRAREAGDVLEGRYRLVGRIGQGGFGDVWRAEELLPDGSALREVALKLLRVDIAETQDWTEEARIIASFRHPALVTIYSAGILRLDADTPFVAMELLRGDTLAEPIARKERVAWRRVLWWARETAAALDEIHRAGVVHLDLKPSNLFLTEEGQLKVLDFGIAQRGRTRREEPARPAARVATPAPEPPAPSPDAMSTAEFVVEQERRAAAAARTREVMGTRTSSGSRTVVGTPGFMAPEIFEGGEPSAAADAYALAACIVQLATGDLPQRVGPRPTGSADPSAARVWFSEVQAATVRGYLRELAADAAGLPVALVALCKRWLALDPLARGVERGGLRAQLDVVWACPHGWGGNPYRGLEPYRPEDEGKLFGRAEDAARLGRELCDQPAVVLQGVGGVGLRSLAVAGIVPELARAFADDRDDWQAVVVELGKAPDSALAAALAPLVGELETDPESRPAASARPAEPEPGPGDASGWLELLRAWASEAHTGAALVLVGLERVLEVPAHRSRRLEALVTGLAAGVPGLRLLATLPEDRTVEILRRDALGTAVRPFLRFLGPPPAGAVRDMVLAPLKASGVQLGDLDAVTHELRAELLRDETRLPLVSLALAAFWQSAGAAQALDGARWQALGGLVGIVARHAEAVFAALEPHEQHVAAGLLLRLVSADGHACAVEERAIASAFDDVASFPSVRDTLLAARLLVRQRGRLRLGHDRLPEVWRRLVDLRLENVERLGFLEELRDTARRWVEGGHRKEELWRGYQLAEIRRHGVADELSDDETAFVEASRRAARLRWGMRGLAAVLVLAAAVGAVALEAAVSARAAAHERARRDAEQRELVSRMVTRSRRASDPYVRVAYLAAAIREGTDDPVLPLELWRDASDLPRAEFLSLERVAKPSFPWNQRWLLGGAGSSTLTVFDFTPVEDAPWGPVIHRFRPHPQGVDEYVAFPFTSAFVTRGLDGALRVWELRRAGAIVLAAESPMRCARGVNAVLVAERAPVVACATAEGLARWDLRKPESADVDAFEGRLLHLSSDGSWLAAARGRSVVFWQPSGRRRVELEVAEVVTAARFSPRDPVVAVLGATEVGVYELDAKGARLAASRPVERDTFDLAWHERGLDVGVCGHGARARWYYLRKGPRAPEDPAPDPKTWPCGAPRPGQPPHLTGLDDYGDLLGEGRNLGPRIYPNGWRLADGKLVTADLVVFDPASSGARRLLSFRGRSEAGVSEKPALGESAASVARTGPDEVVWQVGSELRVYRVDGTRARTIQNAHLLAPCPDGRLLAWRKRDAATWELFAARHDTALRTVPREPAFFVGADPDCRSVFLQRTSGELVAVDPADASAPPRTLDTAGGFVLGGYAYQARPSAARGGLAAGLWLGLSSGAIVRVVGGTGEVKPYGHATPRATALADGPEPGELLFADDTGIVLRAPGARDRSVLDGSSGDEWEDLLLLPRHRALMATTAHSVAVVDLDRHELAVRQPTPPRGRLAPWDEEGSVLVWSEEFMGAPQGEVVPVGPALAGAVANAVSNLVVTVRPGRGLAVEVKR
ncbi:MAG: serine/threonine protein kinase [Myxococcales bacterium]|nr:serine/threonine protein kinase [Myxococcales bacterium]